MKNLTFTVKQKNIDIGRPHTVSCCPIALAVKEKLGRTDGVVVTREAIHVTKSDVVHPAFRRGEVHILPQWNTYRLSKAAKQFVNDFDAGEVVVPARFVVAEVPE